MTGCWPRLITSGQSALRLQYDDAYSDISSFRMRGRKPWQRKVLEPRSAFIPNELGLISYRLGRDNEANTIIRGSPRDRTDLGDALQ